ncbi:MAG: redox-regulated ATPase YchF [Thermoplasmata archaeon]
MEIGVVGKPNVGKSTFFCATTMVPAAIANYPFTTIDANRGITYVRAKCPHEDFKTKCIPRNSRCENGTRFIPVEMIDVAGLVPDAHKGKGQGIKFLDDLRRASALIHVIDASGSTDNNGNIVQIGTHDPIEDIKFLEVEIAYWLRDILGRGFEKVAKRCEMEGGKIENVLVERFTGLGISEKEMALAVKNACLDSRPSKWNEDDLLRLADSIRRVSKPMIIAANKADIAPPENLKKLENYAKEQNYMLIPTSAEIELALRKAQKAGLIDYLPGDTDFKIREGAKLTDKQRAALEKMRDFLSKNNGTGVQKCIEYAVFKMLDLIVVYPVEDEGKLTDKEGRVLPDAYLLKRGSVARDLAFKVHTDLGKNFIRAINARTKRTIGAEYELADGDVIKIVANV